MTLIGQISIAMGAELVYEGSKTKIELRENEIIYYQSRYAFSANWQNLQQIMPSPGTLVLTFSDTKQVEGGTIYKILKFINMHSSLAINYYLTNDNKEFIKQKIVAAKNLTDENEIKFLNQLLHP